MAWYTILLIIAIPFIVGFIITRLASGDIHVEPPSSDSVNEKFDKDTVSEDEEEEE